MNNEIKNILKSLDLQELNPAAYCGRWIEGGGSVVESLNPTDGNLISSVRTCDKEDYETVLNECSKVFDKWKALPAPVRGEYVRKIGEELRKYKKELGALVSLEMGKIRVEGEGEVQEMIDMADYSVGLSRQLYGLNIASERPGHRLMEQWHPLGLVGIISAFNFPVAVWSWNAFLAMVCGDVCIWKPSMQTPLTALATTKIAARVLEKDGFGAVVSLLLGDRHNVGSPLVCDSRVPLISATGSTAMGKKVAVNVGERLGSTILELGGNNAMSVMKSADLELASRAILFGAVGTSGQRCTTTRRIFAHEDIYEELKQKLLAGYKQVKIGNPLDDKTLMGPLVSESAISDFLNALDEIKNQGGKILCGGERLNQKGYFVEPTIVEVDNHIPMMSHEVFAPILYIMKIKNVKQAIELNNCVPQGLSSSIITENMKESEAFVSYMGSDCGLANVNTGTSGAEIGGAFGGEKETGGGREAGSDSWKAYMRRQTSTVNYSKELPLAQGIEFV
ncbi:aldehyde dehydrogenase family protein [bacterium]|nr:aldehyde dehydrogenase family protein [bacterium]|tara:strand:- start:23422 stop:24942 length:1521 start_codon:yes stop_codon:yes gene_type:complete